MISPAQLNGTSDDDLRAHVRAIVEGSARPQSLAPFVTMDVLVRLNNMVVEAVGSTGSKQATLL